MKIAIGEISHETNTFCTLATGMDAFLGVWGEVLTGDEMFDHYRGTNSVVGGFLEGCREARLQVVPTLSARAWPSGMVSREAHEHFRDRLIDAIAAVDGLDGILLALHGAMVADGYTDPESDILTRLRARLGPKIPVFIVLDLHGNIAPPTVGACDLLLGYNTYPHVDTGERGAEAAALLALRLRGDLRPAAAIVRPPLLLPSMNMRTTGGPMATLFAEVREAERRPGVVDISLFGGFPYADIPEAGASIICTTNGNPEQARTLAEKFARRMWDLRHEFIVEVTPAEEALRQALASPEWPVVLADVADNPGSGGAGDTTTLLRLLVEGKVERSTVATIYDPETVAQAVEAGVGATRGFRIGGKTYPAHGGPVEVEAYVRTLSDGICSYKGPLGRGQQIAMGRTAVLVVNGVEVVVTERRLSPNDPEVLRSVGIEPSQRRVMALKVKGHFRANFEGVMKKVIDVDAPGFSRLDLSGFEYRHVRRPIFPLDPDVTY
ncbi:MAG: M81 family metallopeptidase [Armatimonadetes bacterium]|nr:M81 family metallopeptidase [Armatimonadota bacterium]